MKKYVKPVLCYESFALSQHIATCDIDVVNGELVLDDTYGGGGEGTLAGEVLSQENSCEALLEYYCYTNGTNGYKIHAS